MSQLLSFCLCLSLTTLNSLSPLLTTDRRRGIQPVQILLNLWLVYIKRTLKAILLKTTSLAISDYNFLSILYSKKGLTTREFLYTKSCPEKFHPLLRLNFTYTNHHILKNSIIIPIPRTDLFKSSLVYSGNVLWNSLHDSLRLPPSTEMFKSRYMSYNIHYALLGWHCMLYLVIVTSLKHFTILCLPFITHLSTRCLLLMISFLAVSYV